MAEQTNMPNAAMSVSAHQTLDELLQEVSHRGFYGKLVLIVTVEDGILQLIESDTHRKRRVPRKK